MAVRQDQHATAALDECQRQHRDEDRLPPGARRFDEGSPHAAVEGGEDRVEGLELVDTGRDRRLELHDRVHGAAPECRGPSQSSVTGPRWSCSQTNQACGIADDAFRPVQPSRCIIGRRALNTHTRTGGCEVKNGRRVVLSSHARRSSSATLPVVMVSACCAKASANLNGGLVTTFGARDSRLGRRSLCGRGRNRVRQGRC